MNFGILIPIVAILATFAVPIVAIIMDFRRRRLQFEERRAMIERGMQLPPMAEQPYHRGRTPEERHQRSLESGVILLCLGLGLALASFLLRNVITDTFIPRGVVGPMAVGASVLTFLGLGNLLYFALTRKRDGAGGVGP